ncbi:hypothetical protein AAFF_G00205280, partial [Aldrovandia affinis]
MSSGLVLAHYGCRRIHTGGHRSLGASAAARSEIKDGPELPREEQAKDEDKKTKSVKSGKENLLDLLGSMKVKVTSKKKVRDLPVRGKEPDPAPEAMESTISMFRKATAESLPESRGSLTPELVAAASAAASTLPDRVRAESELLQQLRRHEAVSEAQKKGDGNSIGSIIAEMRVGKRPNVRQNTRPANQIHFDDDGRGYTLGRVVTSEPDVHRRSGLFTQKRLNIFSPASEKVEPAAVTGSELSLWDLELANEITSAANNLPRSGFEEMIQWTQEGKLWEYPINNAAGLEEEASVPFHEHVFLDKHLEDGFPQEGPVRHFMELVVAGLARNPHLTVRQKGQHIAWFRDYFQRKEGLLREDECFNCDAVKLLRAQRPIDQLRAKRLHFRLPPLVFTLPSTELRNRDVGGLWFMRSEWKQTAQASEQSPAESAAAAAALGGDRSGLRAAVASPFVHLAPASAGIQRPRQLEHVLAGPLGQAGAGGNVDFINNLSLLEETEDYQEQKPLVLCNEFQCRESCVHQQAQQQQQQQRQQQQQQQLSSPQVPHQQQVPPLSSPVGGTTTTTTTSSSSSPAAAAQRKSSSSRRNAWGNMSYADLITKAIESSPEKRLTLSQIYDWMVKSVPYFKDKGDSNSSAGWKNSIRHNLSLHSRFIRVQNEGTGKSSWWMLNPEGGKSGKSPRRRAASMDNNSKFAKSRGRAAKKKVSLQGRGGGRRGQPRLPVLQVARQPQLPQQRRLRRLDHVPPAHQLQRQHAERPPLALHARAAGGAGRRRRAAPGVPGRRRRGRGG